MLPLLVASLLIAGGFEAGGRIGVVFPASGLERTHDAAAQFGAGVGYETGRNRFTLDYGYSGLQARQASPYQLSIHRISVGYAREFILGTAGSGSVASWGLETGVSAGLGLLGRSVGSAREAGYAPSAVLGVGFFQRQGHSRLSIGLDNFFFGESRPAGSARTVSVTYLVAIKGGVAYVF